MDFLALGGQAVAQAGLDLLQQAVDVAPVGGGLQGVHGLSLIHIWIETIPFDETRQYVQNVLSYAVIYGQKLNAPQPIVDWHERYFDDF